MVIEVNGPAHYCINPPHRWLGRHALRTLLLRRCGLNVVDLPFFEWAGAREDGKAAARLLRRKLDSALAVNEVDGGAGQGGGAAGGVAPAAAGKPFGVSGGGQEPAALAGLPTAEEAAEWLQEQTSAGSAEDHVNGLTVGGAAGHAPQRQAGDAAIQSQERRRSSTHGTTNRASRLPESNAATEPSQSAVLQQARGAVGSSAACTDGSAQGVAAASSSGRKAAVTGGRHGSGLAGKAASHSSGRGGAGRGGRGSQGGKQQGQPRAADTVEPAGRGEVAIRQQRPKQRTGAAPAGSAFSRPPKQPRGEAEQALAVWLMGKEDPFVDDRSEFVI